MTDSSQLPTSVHAFASRFPDERSAAAWLAKHRWPGGFRCSGCGDKRCWQLVTRPRVFECAGCGRQESVTSGTVMHRSKVSLVEWFWATWYLAQDKRGVSALHLSRVLGRRYETVWRLLHKLRAAVAEDDSAFPLEGLVETDEAYLGGKSTKQRGGRSLKDPRRALVVCAAERRTSGLEAGCRRATCPKGVCTPRRALDARDEPGNPGVRGTGVHCGSARFAVVANAGKDSLVGFLGRVCAAGTEVMSDGWKGYDLSRTDLGHLRLVVGDPKRASEVLPLVHTLFANLKVWIAGTFHGVSKRWLPRYVQEFTYRLNRRHHKGTLWNYVLRRAIREPWLSNAALPTVGPLLAA